MLDAEAPGRCIGQTLNLGDAFLVVGRVPLGIVLDLVSEFLETLDLYFSLYPSEPKEDEAEVVVSAQGDAGPDDGPAPQSDTDDDGESADEDVEAADHDVVAHGKVLTVVGLVPSGGLEGARL